jgi:hypothetical protein
VEHSAKIGSSLQETNPAESVKIFWTAGTSQYCENRAQIGSIWYYSSFGQKSQIFKHSKFENCCLL